MFEVITYNPFALVTALVVTEAIWWIIWYGLTYKEPTEQKAVFDK